MITYSCSYVFNPTINSHIEIGVNFRNIYNVFGNYDHLILAINTRTFRIWAAFMREALAGGGEDRIAALVRGYFAFARSNRNAWMAIYDHHLPPDMTMPEEHDWLRGELTEIVVAEVRDALYLRVGGSAVLKETPLGKFKSKAFADLVADHFENLRALLDQLRDEATPFHARPFPQYASRYGDYDHLSRVKEWSAGEGGGG